MKKGIIISIVGIIIIGIVYFGFNMYFFSKGVKEDSQKNIGTNKTELSDYKNSELLSFYKDFENEITDITWTSEPLGKLSGVILRVNEKKYFEIQLDSIPKMFKTDFEFNWKMNEVGNSRIRNIRLVEKN